VTNLPDWSIARLHTAVGEKINADRSRSRTVALPGPAQRRRWLAYDKKQQCVPSNQTKAPGCGFWRALVSRFGCVA